MLLEVANLESDYVNVTNNNGATALIMAAEEGAIETVRVLLSANADIEAGETGSTALQAAECEGHLDVAELLRGHGSRNSSSLVKAAIKNTESNNGASGGGDDASGAGRDDKTTCPSGHRLTRGKGGGGTACDECERTIKRKDGKLACRRCDYDVCDDCCSYAGGGGGGGEDGDAGSGSDATDAEDDGSEGGWETCSDDDEEGDDSVGGTDADEGSGTDAEGGHDDRESGEESGTDTEEDDRSGSADSQK
jgi:hypothetical protein